MLLTLDVGNTHISVAVFQGDRLATQWRHPSSDRHTPARWAAAVAGQAKQVGLENGAVSAAVVASVVPAITPLVMEGVRRAFGIDPAEVGPLSPLPVILDVDQPLSVGADRVVNTLAAVDLYRRDTIVVDFGTATTFDCILADGRFIGGVIAPGLRTSADALVQRAAKLFATELVAPRRVIGRNTEECIQSGVMLGAVDAADGIVRRIKAEWPGGGTPLVVATGGLAGLVVPLSHQIDQVEPQLTSIGLRIAAKHLGQRW